MNETNTRSQNASAPKFPNFIVVCLRREAKLRHGNIKDNILALQKNVAENGSADGETAEYRHNKSSCQLGSAAKLIR